VIGLDEVGEKVCFVGTERLKGVCRLFRKEDGFEPFEDRNPKISSPMHVLYAGQAPIVSLQAGSADGAIYLMLRVGRGEAALPAEALQTLFADATSRKTASAVERLRAEKAARAEKARARQGRPRRHAGPPRRPGQHHEGRLRRGRRPAQGLSPLLAQGSITEGAFDAAVARLKACALCFLPRRAKKGGCPRGRASRAYWPSVFLAEASAA